MKLLIFFDQYIIVLCDIYRDYNQMSDFWRMKLIKQNLCVYVKIKKNIRMILILMFHHVKSLRIMQFAALYSYPIF